MTEKEHPSATQPDQSQSFRSPPEEEINLMDVLEVLLKNKVLILTIASISTILSIFHTKTLAPSYEASIAVLEPQETFRLDLPKKTAEKLPGGSERNPTPFSQFLSMITSYSHKKDVFEQGDFMSKFYGNRNFASDNNKSAFLESAVLGLHHSINISKQKGIADLPDFEKPLNISMVGSNPTVMSEYLTKLVDSAKEKTIANIREFTRSVINHEINNISAKVNKLRLKQEEITSKEILRLSEAMEIASNLGIQNNNFDKLNNQDFQIGVQQSILEGLLEHSTQTSSHIRIVNNSLPLWFLYGEKALQQELKKYKLSSNGQSILGLAEKESELNWYKTIDPSSLDIKVITISQPSIPPTSPVKSKNRMHIVTGMIVGLILGILLAYIRNLMDHLKQRQQAKTLENSMNSDH